MEKVLRQYKNLLIQKRYSQNTQDIYYSYFKDFCIYFRKEILEDIETEQINAYILHLIKSKNISISQQNQRINETKFYYEKVLGRKKEYYELHRPRKENKLQLLNLRSTDIYSERMVINDEVEPKCQDKGF